MCICVCVDTYIYTRIQYAYMFYILYMCVHMLCVSRISLPDNLIINTENERKSSLYLPIIFPGNFSE